MTTHTTDATDHAATGAVLGGITAASAGMVGDATSRAAIRNERVKLASNFLNAVGLTLIAFALLRPVTSDISELTPLSFFWVAMGAGLHGCAHYVLGYLADTGAPER